MSLFFLLSSIFLESHGQISDVSRNSEISIQCYLRTEQPKRGVEGNLEAVGSDIFLGGMKFTPDFDNMHSRLESYDLAGGAGKIQISYSYAPSVVCNTRRNELFALTFRLLTTCYHRANH